MIWAKEFKVSMPENLKLVAHDYTKNYNYEPFNTYKSVANSKMWVIPPLGKNRIRLDDGGASNKLSNVRELVTNITGLALEEKTPILAIWRYDNNFKRCPVHIDDGGEHTGSIVTCISGSFKLHLHEHDDENSYIIKTITIDKNKLVALNNTIFPHSVEGQGDLIVFGTSKQTNIKEYFNEI
jgi:hypothetical protein